jgi:hypothetical protein
VRAVLVGMLRDMERRSIPQSADRRKRYGIRPNGLQSRSGTGSDCLNLLPALLGVSVLCLLTRERTGTGTPGVDQPTPQRFLKFLSDSLNVVPVQ